MSAAKLLFPKFSSKTYSASLFFNKVRFSTFNNKYVRLWQMRHFQYDSSNKIKTKKLAVFSAPECKCYCTKESEDEDLYQMFKNDPELKQLIQQFKSDFSQNTTTEEEKNLDVSSDKDTNSHSSSEQPTERGQLYKEHDRKDVLTEEEKRLNYYKVQEQIVEAEIQDMYTEESEYGYEYETEVKAPPVSLERGKTGVFDISEIVDLLRSENAIDLCVLEIPRHLFYVNHMVLATGKSYRHRLAMAEYIKKLFKQKRASNDQPTVRIEGKESKDWLALDLGNIAVHLFEEKTREHYDPESLWSVGPEHDDLVQLQEKVADPWAALLSERGFFSSVNSEPEETDNKSTRIGVAPDLDMKSMESARWHKIPEDEPS